MGSILAMPLSELMVKDSINNVLVKNITDLQAEVIEPEIELAEVLEPNLSPNPVYKAKAITEDEQKDQQNQELAQSPTLVENEQPTNENPKDVVTAGDEEEETIAEEEYDDSQFEFPTNRETNEDLYDF